MAFETNDKPPKGSLQSCLVDFERDKPLFQTAQKLASELIINHPKICQKIIDRWIVSSVGIINV